MFLTLTIHHAMPTNLLINEFTQKYRPTIFKPRAIRHDARPKDIKKPHIRRVITNNVPVLTEILDLQPYAGDDTFAVF